MSVLIVRSKSKSDTAVVILVFIQIAYCYWEVFLSLGIPRIYAWQFLSSIVTYAIILFALPGYIRMQKWAWAMIFLFSLYILHQTFILKLYGQRGMEGSLAILEIVASALCLRILSSTAKDHAICRGEFAKVLGAIAISVAVIFVRGNYIPPFRSIIAPSVSPWVSIESMSQITAWRMLMLLWCCYAGICIIGWVTARYIPMRSTHYPGNDAHPIP